MIQETERAGQVAHVELKPPPAPFSASQRELAKCLADCGVCGTDAHAMISDVSMKSGYTYESPLDEIESSVMGKMKEIFSIFKAKKPEPDADESDPKAPSDADPDDKKKPGQNGAFIAKKQADGTYRWVAVYSDTNWDRDKERFTAEAHKDYVDWVDRTKNYPDLRLWHIPGTTFGKTDMIDMDTNGYMVATGTIDAGKEFAVEALRKSDKVLGISHGFYFPSLINGEYSKGYRTYEISVLPWEKAANENTGFFAGEETPMLTPEKKAFIASALGDQFASRLETTLAEASSKAKENGVSFKQLMESVIDGVEAKEAADIAAKNASQSASVDTNAIVEQLKAFMAPQLDSINETLKSYETKFASLEASDDDKISKAMSQKKGFNPTSDSSTSADGRDGEVKAAKIEMSKKDDGGLNLPSHLKEYGELLRIGVSQ